ncbi:hypothetical protein M3629_25770 [Paenibacillus polysaccharolyticus]|nr:hypothetical protein [Paenibacillus polysaccharolyticus]MCM3136182.1 hypothetical protein [Paenibacillus polysaccharolyticus]
MIRIFVVVAARLAGVDQGEGSNLPDGATHGTRRAESCRIQRDVTLAFSG